MKTKKSHHVEATLAEEKQLNLTRTALEVTLSGLTQHLFLGA